MKQLTGYKTKRSGKLLLHLLVNKQQYPAFHCRPAGDSNLQAGLNSRDWKHYSVSSILIVVSSFTVLLLTRKYQTLATHTWSSQHFLHIPSPVAVVGVNVVLFAFRRDPSAQWPRWLVQSPSKSVVGLGKAVSLKDYTPSMLSPHLLAFHLYFSFFSLTERHCTASCFCCSLSPCQAHSWSGPRQAQLGQGQLGKLS